MIGTNKNMLELLRTIVYAYIAEGKQQKQFPHT